MLSGMPLGRLGEGCQGNGRNKNHNRFKRFLFGPVDIKIDIFRSRNNLFYILSTPYEISDQYLHVGSDISFL